MAGLLVKVVIDTSVYIPFINKGTSHPLLELGHGVPLFYMSTVVIEELYAGASDDASIKLLDNLYKTFDSAGRLIVPDAVDWQKAGRIVSKLGSKYGFEEIFSRQIKALVKKGDLVVAISTSGNSPNVLAGVKAAKKIGAATVGLTGQNGGRLKNIADLCLRVPSNNVARIQECHQTVGHIICEIAEKELSKPR